MLSVSYEVGQNKTKVGLKAMIRACGVGKWGGQNKTKVGLKVSCSTVFVIANNSQNKTKVGLKGYLS